MIRFFTVLFVFTLLTAGLPGAGPRDLPNQTASRVPAPLPLAGKWRRIDLAYEKEFFTADRWGQVRMGESGLEVGGRCRLLTAMMIRLDLRTPFGFQRLTCRWWKDHDNLVLEVLESKSKTSDQDVYQTLDQDRSAAGQTWRFKQAR